MAQSQKSRVVPIRLRPHEMQMLDRIRKTEMLIDANNSEIIRLLIHREFNRRTTGMSVVAGSAVASDHRDGRPPAEKPADPPRTMPHEPTLQSPPRDDVDSRPSQARKVAQAEGPCGTQGT